MNFSLISLFPESVARYLQQGLIGQALGKGLIGLKLHQLRDFTSDPHRSVDDRCFGGGDGMVLKIEPLERAVHAARAESPAAKVIVFSPEGRVWDQKLAASFAQAQQDLILVCGRYAGFDQRFVTAFADEVISLGDFVLNGGELAALCVIESVARLLPGVLGNAESARCDSFSDEGGWLEAPQFTRPRSYAEREVPAVLLSGNHAEIEKFWRDCRLIRTRILRSDLLGGGAAIKTQVEHAARRLLQLTESELAALGFFRARLEELSR